MRILRRTAALILGALLVTLTACARESKQPEPSPASLDEIRAHAAAAFDGTAASAQRRSAADEAMRKLLALLVQPESTAIPEEEWSASPRPGVARMVRHEDLGGGIHLYALALPGNSMVELRERVAIQVRKTGRSPRATELALLPDSRVEAARSLQEGTRQMVTLALRTNQGDGYVAHFEASGDAGFQPVASAFAGISGQYGPIHLAVKESFLMVSSERSDWQPAFDQKQPLRLNLAPELTLDWKDRFVLVDDSRFDAFRLMAIARDPGLCKGPADCPEAVRELAKRSPGEAAVAAWERATAKLTALLQDERSWADDFAGRLPEGARSLREEGRDLAVRLLSVQAPKGAPSPAFTAVQFRTGGGIPMVRTLDLPGPVENYRVASHEGIPALFLVADQSPDPKGSLKSKGLHLFRLDAGNDWRSAQDWVGAVPEAAHWNLTGVSRAGLQVSWESEKLPSLTVSLESGPEPRVAICKLPSDCHHLTWVDDRLHSLDILVAQLNEATQALPEGQLLWLANQLAGFLALVDPAEVPAARLTRLIDPTGSLGVQVLEAGGGTQLVTMPANPTGLQMAVIHSRGQGLVAKAHEGFVTRWEDGRVVAAGEGRRLLILGRSNKGAVLLAYDWDGSRWVEADALPTKVDRIIKESMRVIHNPGASRPARGLFALGDKRLLAVLTDAGARFCEDRTACLTYGYSGGWQLK